MYGQTFAPVESDEMNDTKHYKRERMRIEKERGKG
jgi:hypothetical protein